MAKKKTEEVPDATPVASSKGKGAFLANLTKRTGITTIPFTELAKLKKTTYLDTGSYTMNALVSASIFKGVASDNITCIAGEPATGKTYLCLTMCERFLAQDPNNVVFYFDTEGAIKPHLLMSRALPEDRFILKKVKTVEVFRMEVAKIIEDYKSYKESDRPQLLIVLDSLGNISTMKEKLETIKETDKQAKDMTRAQLIRSLFRVVSTELEELNIPMIFTNHVGIQIGAHTAPGMPPPKVMAGGEGLKYNASTIVFLSKTSRWRELEEKVSDEDETPFEADSKKKAKTKKTKRQTGVTLRAKLYKSRDTIENLAVTTELDFVTGLDRYAGLFELAKAFGVAQKSGNGFTFLGGKTFFTKNIEENPEEYFTPEVLKLIDEKVGIAFQYGQGVPMELTGDEDDEE